MLSRPEPAPTLPQTLYTVAAHTGIVLDPSRLSGVLFDAREHAGQRGTEAVTLELRIDVTSRERMREAAAKVREVADMLEGSGGQADHDEGPVFTRLVAWPVAMLLLLATVVLLIVCSVAAAAIAGRRACKFIAGKLKNQHDRAGR